MPAWVGGVGPDWVLDAADVPRPRAGQVLIRVAGAGLNRADLYMLQGTYNAGAANLKTFVAGLELAVGVAALGDGVDRLAVGDRVMGTTLGAFAHYAVADHRHVVPVPDTLSLTDAAGLPVALTTEHDALVQAGFQAGQRVLIVGATSGVGMVGVQMAKALGAGLVVATTTSAAKADALRRVGADVVVNTSIDDFAAVIGESTDGAGIDVVLDHVGGELFARLFAAVRPRGTIVNIGRLGGPTTTIDLDQLAFRRLHAIGTTFSIRTAEERGEVVAALVPEVLPAVAKGLICPIIDRVIPFDDALQAAELMRANAAVGKLVLAMPDGHAPDSATDVTHRPDLC